MEIGVASKQKPKSSRWMAASDFGPFLGAVGVHIERVFLMEMGLFSIY